MDINYPVFIFVFEVLRDALNLCRKPLSLIVFLWLIQVALVPLSSALVTTLSPTCGIPWIRELPFCRHRHGLDAAFPQWADYPRFMNVQSSTFEQLLDTAVGNSGLSLDIKKAEMAVMDLAVVVRSSTLGSRDILGETLVAFAHDARKVGRGLQRLSSKVAAAVDLIMATNEYAITTISKTQQSSSDSFSSKAMTYLFPDLSTERAVLRSFAEAMRTLSTVVERLILFAELELANLEALEERLAVLYEMVVQENSAISTTKAELLQDIWTWLGGNRNLLKGYDEHLDLLSRIADYRKRALVQVISALHILRALSNDMEGLREQMSKPALSGQTIPVEIQISSIELGLRRLQNSRALAREKEEASAELSYLEDETTKKVFAALDAYKVDLAHPSET
ncbi:hypothetical protein FB446DRAFT_654962 [Lentinula raphanica]|nr:hypothetical protein FB446DRAFT_654962 [Lentinula raphanica]